MVEMSIFVTDVVYKYLERFSEAWNKLAEDDGKEVVVDGESN